MKWFFCALLIGTSLSTADFNDPSSIKDHDFFLSFWRTGTNWLYSCIQAITCKPTRYIVVDKAGLYTSNACKNHLRLPLDHTKPPLYQTHSCAFVKRFSSADNRLLLIVRNYKEALLRHFEDDVKAFSNALKTETIFDYYAEYLHTYDAWDPTMRLLIYYEDLLLHPYPTLKKVIQFLGESSKNLDQFMANYENYKHKTLSSYHDQYKKDGGSMSKGLDLFYHSNKTPKNLLLQADTLMKRKYPTLFDRYLLSYQER